MNVQFLSPREYIAKENKTGYGVRKAYTAQVKQNDSDDRTLDFVISTSEVDRDGDVIDPKGLDFSNYKKNPVVLAFHDSSKPIGKTTKLRVGSDKVTASVKFMGPELSEEADRIFRMSREGFISGASIGFIPKDFELSEDRPGGLDFKSAEILEWSVVSIPSNSSSLAERSRDTIQSQVKDFLDQEIDTTSRANTAESILRGFSIMTKNTDKLFEKDPSLAFGGVIQALYHGHGNPEDARAWSKDKWGLEHPITKALSAGQGSGGGFLVPEDLSSEVIELLRPRSAVRAMNPRVMRPTSGSMSFPKITSGVTASYVGENEVITQTEPTFGTVELVARKLAALTPISRDLLMYAEPDALAVVRDEMVAEIAETEDANLLRGDGTGGAPRGLRFLAQSANVSSSNGTGSTAVEADMTDLLEDLEGNNVRMERPFFLMSSRSKNFLLTLRDANGSLIYPELRNTTPTILTVPVIVSNSIPNTLGAGSDSEIYLVDAEKILFGEVETVEVSTSAEGSYTVNGSLRSAFERDQQLIRAVLRHDIQTMHPEAIAVKTGISYGA